MILILALACSKPPPAPEGLDAATSYMVRNFYADDAAFQAGIQGFMQWYTDEGYLLVGQQATSDNTNSFVVAELAPEDVDWLPLEDELLVDPSAETYEPRDLTRAPGVVSLAEMQCAWDEAEQYLLRADQDVIFSDDWEGYERTYLGDRATYESGTTGGEFDPIEEAILPFGDDFDDSVYGRTILRTENMVDPKAVLTADIESYPMHLDFRHGTYVVDEDALSAFAILTWIDQAAWGSAGDSALLQSYSIELDIESGDDTLRMLAVWTEPKGGGIEPDSALALNYAVNKSLKSSERISAICGGEEEVPAEP